MQKRKRILIICPYPPGTVPSQRFRFEQYLELLKAKGFHIRLSPFFSKRGWRSFNNSGILLRGLELVIGFCKRAGLLFNVLSYDLIVIHREATPLGPPVVEWILSKGMRKKFIYDFDDAIWLTDRENEFVLLRVLKSRSKVKYLCQWASKISCGNSYLADYASKFNSHVFIIPTTVDTENYHNPRLYPVNKKVNEITIGWTGSSSTIKYLQSLKPVLTKLSSKYLSVHFLFTADENPDLELPRTKFIPWSKENEIPTLLQFDIGVMPLPNDPWTQGKGGFKALQYLSLEIPAVVSPVGINTEIVQHGVSGYLPTTHDDWLNFLSALVENAELRNKMGKKGRAHVISNYSVTSVSAGFLKLFE